MRRPLRLLAGASLILSASLPLTAHAEQKLAVIPAQFDATAKGMVPALFDDYLLTAVQNMGGYEVIGQEDISAMLGFEQQKDLVDCSDTSCIADIGGALGVDKLVVVKIARLNDDWVATAKIINIKAAKVESRINQIISGDVKKLLEATPEIVAKLFGKAVAPHPASPPPPPEPARPPPPPPRASAPPPSDEDEEPAPSTAATAAPPASVTAPTPNEDFGRGYRIIGVIMLIGGAVTWTLGALGMSFIAPAGSFMDPGDFFINTAYLPLFASHIIGLVAMGVGTKLRASGAAKRDFANNAATSSPAVYWLGWVLAGTSMGCGLLMPMFAGLMDEGGGDPATISTTATMWISAIGASAIFMIGGFGAYGAELETAALQVTPSFGVARAGRDAWVPTAGVLASF